MSVLWEWLGDGGIERQIEVVPVLSEEDDEYGGGYTYDEFAPVETESFFATGLTWTEVAALRTNVRTRGSSYSITDKVGRAFTGRLTSVKWDPIDGIALWEVTARLLIPPVEPS